MAKLKKYLDIPVPKSKFNEGDIVRVTLTGWSAIVKILDVWAFDSMLDDCYHIMILSMKGSAPSPKYKIGYNCEWGMMVVDRNGLLLNDLGKEIYL